MNTLQLKALGPEEGILAGFDGGKLGFIYDLFNRSIAGTRDAHIYGVLESAIFKSNGLQSFVAVDMKGSNVPEGILLDNDMLNCMATESDISIELVLGVFCNTVFIVVEGERNGQLLVVVHDGLHAEGGI